MYARRLPLLAAVAAISMLAPASAFAQTPVQEPDQEELETFAEAFVEVAEVREEMTPRILQAQSPEEATELQAEADERVIGVLGEHELDAAQYNGMIQLLSSDEELRAEFEEIVMRIRDPGF